MAGAPVIHDEPDSTKIYDRERNIAGYLLRKIGNVEEASASPTSSSSANTVRSASSTAPWNRT